MDTQRLILFFFFVFSFSASPSAGRWDAEHRPSAQVTTAARQAAPTDLPATPTPPASATPSVVPAPHLGERPAPGVWCRPSR